MNKVIRALAVAATVLAVMFAGSVPLMGTDSSADTGPDYGAAYSDIRDAVVGFNGDGWEFGAQLQLNDEQAFDYYRTIVSVLPEDLRGGLDRYLDGYTLDDIYDQFYMYDVTASADGGLTVLVTCEKTADGGYTYTLLSAGYVALDRYVTVGDDDGVEMYSDAIYELDMSLSVVVDISADLVPMGGSFDLVLDAYVDGEYNYSPENGAWVAVDPIMISNTDTVKISGGVWADDLTVYDIRDILLGEGSKTVGFTLLLEMDETYTENGGEPVVVTDKHMEASTSIDVPCGILNGAEMPPEDDAEAIMDIYLTSGTYGLVQVILEQYGIFITEEKYVEIVSVLTDIKDQLCQENLDFYYIHSGSGYNTSLKDTILESVADVEQSLHVFVIPDDGHVLTFHLDTGLGVYILDHYEGDPSLLPESINGIPLVTTGTSAEETYTVDGIVYAITVSGDGEREAGVVGFADGTTNATITDSVTIDGTEYSVRTVYVIGNGAQLNTVKVSGLDNVYIIRYTITDLTVEGSTYLCLDNANVTGLTLDDVGACELEHSTVGTIHSDGTTYMSSDSFTTVETLAIHSDEQYNLSVSDFANIQDLGSLSISGEIYNIWGDVNLAGYSGIGGTYDYGGITYNLRVSEGTFTAQARCITDGATEITIVSEITYGGYTYSSGYHLNGDDTVQSITVKSIPNSLYICDFDALTTVTFDNEEAVTLNSIMFEACSNLETVTFKGPLNNVGMPFFDCSEISTIEFFSSVGDISHDAFSNLSRVTSITFHGDVGTLHRSSFGSMTNLQTVFFEGNVEGIDNAFRYCGNLSTIYIQGDLGTLGNNEGCHSLCKFYVCGEIGTIRSGAFDSDPYVKDVNEEGEAVLIPSGWALDAKTIGHIEERAFTNVSMLGLYVQESIVRIDAFAFNSVSINFDTEKLLTSKYCDPQAFKNCTINGEAYTGVSSCHITVKELTDATYWLMPYVADMSIVYDVCGIQAHQSSVTIPESITLGESDDATTIGIRSIGICTGPSFYTDSLTLTIRDNVRELGNGFRSLFNVGQIGFVFGEDSPYDCLSDGGLVMVVKYTDSGYETVAVFINNGTGEVTVPEGIASFDLSCLGSGIETVNTGDSLKTLILSDIMEFRVLNIGANVSEIVFFERGSTYTPNLKTITVDPANTHYAVRDGVLYGLDGSDGTATLLLCPMKLTGDVIIPGSLETDSGTYTVSGIREYAFAGSRASLVILPDSITEIPDWTFDDSQIAEIILPETVQKIRPYAFTNIVSHVNIHTNSGDISAGNVVYTLDGMTYLLRHSERLVDGEYVDVIEKCLIAYSGDIGTLEVEDGTTAVLFLDIGSSTINRIILPETTEYWSGYILYVEGETTLILAPSDIYIDPNWGTRAMVRTYEVSDHFSWSFSCDDDGVMIEVTMSDHHNFEAIVIGDRTYQNGATIPWSVLFDEQWTSTILDDVMTVHYTVDTFDVTYIDGVTDHSEPVQYGDVAPYPDNPERAGYMFAGWYADEGCTVAYDFSAPITEDTSIYAKWERLYTVSVATEGLMVSINGIGWIDSETTIWVGSGQYWFDYTIDNGYHGDITVTDDLGNVLERFSYIDVNRDITISAEGLLKDSETFLNIVFINDQTKGTCDTASLTVPYGETIELPVVTAAEGYRFVGWTYGSLIVSGPCYIDRDMQLVAAYAKLPVYVTIDFDVDNDKGTLIDEGSVTVLKGERIQLPDVESVDGWTFIGWRGEGCAMMGDYLADESVTLVAEFRESGTEVFQITLDMDGSKGTLDGSSVAIVDEGATYTLPIPEGKNGYRFLGWFLNGEPYTGTTVTVTEPMTFTADFMQGFFVTFAVSNSAASIDGTETVFIAAGNAVIFPTVNVPSGYSISGWTVDGQSISAPYIPTSDVTITAKVTRNQTPTTPTTPTEPEVPEVPADPVDRPDDVYVNDDGSTTTVVTNDDGTKTVTDEKKIENGTETKESVYDSNKELMGTTTVTKTEETTEAGNTVSTVTTKVEDANGSTTSEVTRTEAVSDDGSIRTTAITTTDKDGNTVSESTTVVSVGGTAGIAVVDDESVRKAIEQMSEAVSADTERIISIEPEGSEENAKVTMSQEAMQSIVESGADMMIGGQDLSIRVSSDVSKNLSSMGGDVAMSVGKANKNTMNPVQQERIGNAPVFQLTADVAGQSVHELGGTVTVTVPYELGAGENPDDIRVFYLDDDGGLHVKKTVYDAETKTITFETDHFSYYMVGTVADIPEDVPPSDDSDNDNTMLYIGIAVVAVIVVIVAIVAVRRP